MNELEVQESSLDPVIMPEREPALQPVPTRNPTAVRGFATAVSLALGKPEKEAEIAAVYELNGKSQEWDASLEMFLNAKTETERAKVVQLVSDIAIAENTDFDAVLNSGRPEVAEALAKAKARITLHATSPEATAAAHTMVSDLPLEARRSMNLDGALASHLAEKDKLMAEMLQRLQETGAEGIPNDTTLGEKTSMLAGLTEMLAPFKYGFVVSNIMTELVDKYNKDNPPGTPLEEAASWLRRTLLLRNPLTAGESMRMGLETFTKLTPEEQREFGLEMIELLNNEPLVFTDFQTQALVNELLDPEVLYGDDPDARGMWRWFDNILPLIELVGLKALIKGTAASRAGRTFSDIPIPDNGLRFSDLDAMKRLEGQVSPEARSADLADVFTYRTSAEARAATGLTPEQVGRTQMPGFSRTPRHANDVGVIEDIPDALLDEAGRIRQIRMEAGNIVDKMRGAGMTRRLRDLADKNQYTKLERMHGSLLRPALTRATPHADSNGVQFNVVLGTSDTRGFSTKGQALTEALRLTNMDIDGVKIYSSVGGRLTPHAYTKDLLKNHVKAIDEKKLWDEPGNWYVGYTKDYFYRPEDRILFDKPIIGNGYLGTLGRWIETPSSQFSKPVYELYAETELLENSLISKLNQVVAPYTKMPHQVQRRVDDMYEWTNKHYTTQERAPTLQELKEAFPDATDEMFRGYYLMKEHYEIMYDINNYRLYRDQQGRGFKTLRNIETGQEYNGKLETARGLAPDFHNGTITVYDPAKMEMLSMTVEELNTLYKHGGRILRMDTRAQVGDGNYASLIMKDPLHLQWELQPLTRWPLKYEEGYYPRMYEEPYYIYEFVQGAKLNGKPVKDKTFINGEELTGLRRVLAVVGTQSEADQLIKRRLRDNPEGVFRVGTDARLSTKDRVARDLEFMQTEGRLFFDNREGRLKNIRGNDADIVSPTNMLSRSASMLSRQLATEEIIKSLKMDWKSRYGGLLQSDIERQSSSAVRAELVKIINSGSVTDRKLAIEAHQTWDYIDLMEGNVQLESQFFRRQSVVAAELLANILTGGRPTSTSTSKWLLRNAHKIAPVETMKSIAFLDFIQSRPLRQVVLQASQQMFIGALDVSYIGAWQRDQFALLNAIKARNKGLAGGKKAAAEVLKRNAKIMGVTEAEFKIILQQFDESGLLQTINKHSFAGDLPKTEALPATRAGDVVQGVRRTVTAAPIREVAQRSGFDLGEQINVTASFLMALRLWRKANKIKIKDMTRDHWREVVSQADGYALSMHRANSAKFQYGKLSMATQFMSFTHKVALTFLRAAPYSKELNLGNQAFTPAQARSLLAAQVILFGFGSGFGLKPEVEGWLTDSNIGTDWDPETRARVIDLLAGGSLDFIVDEAIQKAFDTDLDIAWDTFLAPGANVINTAREFTKFVLENPIPAAVFGAFGSTASRFAEASQRAYQVVRIDNEIDTWEKWSTAASYVLGGFLSGWSDMAKAGLARKMGYFIAQNGDMYAAEATWQEILAKGLFGIRDEESLVTSRQAWDQSTYEKALDDEAYQYYSRMKAISLAQREKGDLDGRWLDQAATINLILNSSFTEQERHYIIMKFGKLSASDSGTKDGLDTIIAESVMKGVPVNAQLKAAIKSLTTLTDEERDQLYQLVEDNQRNFQESFPEYTQMQQRELELAKEFTDAN